MSSFTMTPIGAAIIEAMPDRDKMKKIQRKYRRTGKVPFSSIFPDSESFDKFNKENSSDYRIDQKQTRG